MTAACQKHPMVKIEPSWGKHLATEFDKPYFGQLTEQVREEYRRETCFPPGRLVFNAFNLCPFDKVKVVIIGQDPYHEPGQAMGLSFSVPVGTALPTQYIQGDRKRFGQTHAIQWRPDSMGGAGRVATQCHSHRKGTCGQQPSAFRMERIHRRGHQGVERGAATHRIHAMGWLCSRQTVSHRPAAQLSA